MIDVSEQIEGLGLVAALLPLPDERLTFFREVRQAGGEGGAGTASATDDRFCRGKEADYFQFDGFASIGARKSQIIGGSA